MKMIFVIHLWLLNLTLSYRSLNKARVHNKANAQLNLGLNLGLNSKLHAHLKA
jgi:hypothetical protein